MQPSADSDWISAKAMAIDSAKVAASGDVSVSWTRSGAILIRPIAGALGAVALVFVVYEAVERIWLTNAELATLHRLHLLRGILTSVLSCVVFGAIFWKSRPAGWAVPPLAQDRVRSSLKTREETLLQCARWFIQMRWVAMLGAIALIVVSVRIFEILPPKVFWPLLTTAVGIGAVNLVFIALLRDARWQRYVLPLQFYADLTLLIVLLHFGGGIENPLSLLLIIHIILGGILLSRRACFGIAVTASFLFAVLALAEMTHVLDHYTLKIFPHLESEEHVAHDPLYVVSHVGLESLFMFLVAYFVTTLAERTRRDEMLLEASADEAEAQRELLEQALESTDTGLEVFGADLAPVWINDRWKQWFGDRVNPRVRPSDLDAASQPSEGLDQVGPFASQVLDTLGDGKVRIRDIELTEAGGGAGEPEASERTPRWFQITTAPLRDRDGGIDKVVCLGQDVTAQKLLQTQMMQAGKMAAIGELSGNVAHEVNNPIAIISAKSRLLLSDHRGDMSDKIASEIEKIVGLGDRVARISQGLLSYCRRSEAERSPIDLREPVMKALGLVEQRARSAGVRIENELGDRAISVLANANEIEQVFLNLFINALDAMPDGGGLTFSVTTEQDSGTSDQAFVLIAVEDTGSGIDHKIQAKIFEPFFTTKDEGKGTGLGLSICQGIIRSHDGELSLAEGARGGARFIIRLPIASEPDSGGCPRV